MSVREALPHWDLSPFFPGPDSVELETAMLELSEGIAALGELLDARGIGVEAELAGEEAAAALDEALECTNDLWARVRLVRGYLFGEISVDSRNEAAQARLSELQLALVPLANLQTRITAWLGTLDVDDLVERSQSARAHEYALRRAQVQAEHLMARAEEELATELSLTGSTAWTKLHGDFSSQLEVEVELDGERRRLPMSEVRNLASNPDRDARRAGYEAELGAWELAAVPLAAALNSIKGEVNALSRRRGWDSPLDAALFANGVDRETLDAMLEAVRESLPHFGRYFEAKARALGVRRLCWYDLGAPLGGNGRVWSFEEGREFIAEQFGTYSERMRAYAERAFRERWIDAEPRAGKRDGAFCMAVRGDQSRILANFTPAYRGVSTLAHELGHGYHAINLAQRTEVQKQTPMTLAETASIFCETVVREGALEAARDDAAEQLEILEGSLETAAGVVVDVYARFLFESRLLERRQQRELSVAELCELMAEAEREAYGDVVAGDLHPYLWAVKPHFYMSAFYNYPYTFGLLFGLGLYAGYEQDADGFRAGYDELLSSTGLADAATLAARFGIDTRSVEFWRSSLDVVRGDVERFAELV